MSPLMSYRRRAGQTSGTWFGLCSLSDPPTSCTPMIRRVIPPVYAPVLPLRYDSCARRFPAVQQYWRAGSALRSPIPMAVTGFRREGGTCVPPPARRLLRGPLAAQFYYVYAMDERGGEWKGKSFHVHPRPRVQDRSGARTVSRAALIGRAFSRVDTGRARPELDGSADRSCDASGAIADEMRATLATRIRG